MYLCKDLGAGDKCCELRSQLSTNRLLMYKTILRLTQYLRKIELITQQPLHAS